MELLDSQPQVEKTSLFGTSVHAVLKSGDPATPPKLADALKKAGIEVSGFGPVAPSLEDVFLDVVERVGAA